MTNRYAIPRALSEGEETFMRDCKIERLAPEREFRFAPEREYRFDFAWPSQKIAVEIDGGTEFGKSRHSFGAGYERDARKFNLAARRGWRVLRFTTAMVKSGEAIRETLEALHA